MILNQEEYDHKGVVWSSICLLWRNLQVNFVSLFIVWIERMTSDLLYCTTRSTKTSKLNKNDVSLRVLALGSLNLENDEVRNWLKQDLIEWGKTRFLIAIEQNNQKGGISSRPKIEYNFLGLPVPSSEYKSVPMTLLVQNPFMNRNFSSTSLKLLEFKPKSEKVEFVFDLWVNGVNIGNVVNYEKYTKKLKKWLSQSNLTDSQLTDSINNYKKGIDLFLVLDVNSRKRHSKSHDRMKKKIQKLDILWEKVKAWKVEFDEKLFEHQDRSSLKGKHHGFTYSVSQASSNYSR